MDRCYWIAYVLDGTSYHKNYSMKEIPEFINAVNSLLRNKRVTDVKYYDGSIHRKVPQL